MRRVYRGTVVGVELRLQPGAHVRTIDAEGNPLADTFEPDRRLRPNIGDRLIVADADLASDAIAAVVIDAIDRAGTPTVRTLCGELPRGAVHVLPGRKAKAPARPKRRGTLALPGAPIAAIVRRARVARSAP
jgi:hypothetical protein